MTILIVDDDGDDRELFCETLKEVAPFSNCVIFNNGESALQYLRAVATPPDFIFLDIYLQGMDGKECLLKIKSIRTGQKVPVIMYSGSDAVNQIAIYRKLGAADFISKPSSIEDLRKILLSIVGELDHPNLKMGDVFRSATSWCWQTFALYGSAVFFKIARRRMKSSLCIKNTNHSQ